MKYKFLLLIVILFGFLLRVVGLTDFPPSLNWDEVSLGYNSYSILKTGADEWGVRLPAIFKSYGDYKLPVYIYTSVPSILFFGLTPFGIRLPSVIAGTLTILFTYLIVKILFKTRQDSEYLSLAAALFVAIEPWSLFLSRIALEANMSLMLITGGVYFFLKGLKNGNFYLVLSSLSLSLSVWTYNSARVFVPLFAICMFFVYRKELFSLLEKKKVNLGFAAAIFIALIIPTFIQLLNSSGQARYQSLQIIDQGAINTINESRNNSNLAPMLSKIVNNKVVFFSKQFVTQYIYHFSPIYLFITGGDHYQFSVQGRGLLYLISSPFIMLGLIYLLKQKSKETRLLLFWLLLSPVASSITRDSPHVLRSITVLPLPMIFAALGVLLVWKFLKIKRLHHTFLVSFFIVLGVSVMDYSQTAILDYRTNYSSAWQYGYREAVEFTKSRYNNYDSIIFTKKYGEPHEFVLFYNQWDPKSYISSPSLNRFMQSNWWWVDGFDKYYFVNDWEIKANKNIFILESKKQVDCLNSRCLLVTSPGNVPENWEKLETISFLDRKAAFEIYEN